MRFWGGEWGFVLTMSISPGLSWAAGCEEDLSCLGMAGDSEGGNGGGGEGGLVGR